MANTRGENPERDQYFEKRAGTDEARYHVVPHDDKGWAVKEEGKDEPLLTTGDRKEAMDEAKRRAEEAGTMAIIHNEHGRIEDQINYQDNQ
ncbi:DUF2188 domain-containing protein [Paenibacillus sp. JX-17]|uniref:DUF2188 domain-containing protein n=1 Tax=Paenibacillus lacisoli TaxID=3064525 RepID=A0ABT9CJX6_9BACL|nr:DUF2188 domain-containing protein [Paenibacillus sp. JX-17]MDO7907961.1 DUF2188 domain-containing protein [Paenibacillus sp. JX-17]